MRRPVQGFELSGAKAGRARKFGHDCRGGGCSLLNHRPLNSDSSTVKQARTDMGFPITRSQAGKLRVASMKNRRRILESCCRPCHALQVHTNGSFIRSSFFYTLLPGNRGLCARIHHYRSRFLRYMKGFTAEQIDALKSPRGGWTKEALAKLGVEWPPKRGWRKRLLANDSVPSNIPHDSSKFHLSAILSAWRAGGGFALVKAIQAAELAAH